MTLNSQDIEPHLNAELTDELNKAVAGKFALPNAYAHLRSDTGRIEVDEVKASYSYDQRLIGALIVLNVGAIAGLVFFTQIPVSSKLLSILVWIVGVVAAETALVYAWIAQDLSSRNWIPYSENPEYAAADGYANKMEGATLASLLCFLFGSLWALDFTWWLCLLAWILVGPFAYLGHQEVKKMGRKRLKS